MPVTNIMNQKFPKWAEVNFYEISSLKYGKDLIHKRKSKKEILFVGFGSLEITHRHGHLVLEAGDNFNLIDEDVFLKAMYEGTTLIIIGGDWGELIGNCGVFSMNNSDNHTNIGDPTEYERKTNFDNHFHDCDEYWIIFEGNAEVVTESKRFIINKGDCVITKKGDHHDIVNIIKTLRGVYFETSLKGKKRRGHLWNHTHN